MTSTEFLLKLGNGTGWLIVSTSGTKLWVERFAGILGLEPHEQNQHSKWPKIIFFQKDSGKYGLSDAVNLIDLEIEEDLPRSGWKAHNFPCLRFWYHRKVPDIICEIGNENDHELDIIRMWTSLYSIYLQLKDTGGLPLHAALVERDGQGVLLAGPGGSGKSTICSRLPHPWSILSDDQALIVFDDRRGYLAHPIPTWSGYLARRDWMTCNVKHYVSLAAIFFVEQARSDQVIPMGQGRAAVFINHSSTDVCRPIWRGADVQQKIAIKKKIFNNSCNLAKAIPAHILQTSLEGRFWEEIERVIF